MAAADIPDSACDPVGSWVTINMAYNARCHQQGICCFFFFLKKVGIQDGQRFSGGRQLT
jgi:hypothetical protein